LFPVPPTKKKQAMDKEEISIAIHDYYEDLHAYYPRLREVDPRTGIEKQMRVNLEYFYTDNLSIFSEADRRLFSSLLSTFENLRKTKG